MAESERLSRLLENVLNFARVEKGVRRYRPAEVDLPDAVHSAVQSFRYVLDQEGFQIHEQTEGEPLRAYADRDALVDAVLNLLSNAVKYSGTSREIRLLLRRSGHGSEIQVTDFGRGIPRGEQQKIFEDFYRTADAIEDTAGAGLGLSLVRHFAQAHGGRVSVASAPGRGSTFVLWLPAPNDASGSEITHGQDLPR